MVGQNMWSLLSACRVMNSGIQLCSQVICWGSAHERGAIEDEIKCSRAVWGRRAQEQSAIYWLSARGKQIPVTACFVFKGSSPLVFFVTKNYIHNSP
jgi:hypothetical protein